MNTFLQKTTPAVGGNTMMLTVFLPGQGFPERSALAKALLPGRTEVDVTICTDKNRETMFLFREGVHVCSVLLIDDRVPMQATDAQFKNAWYWPGAWKEVSPHRSHIVISVIGGGSANERALTLQRLLDAVLSCEPSAIAVNNTSCGTLLPVEAVSPWLKRDGVIAVPLYLSCHYAREEPETFSGPGIFVSTKGLGDFGLMEIEGRGFVGRIDELQEFILSFAAYLIDRPPIIRDGDLVGSEHQDEVVVRIVRSVFCEQLVYCLQFQMPTK